MPEMSASSRNYLPHKVNREIRADGSVVLTSGHALPETVDNTGKWLERWASDAPQRTFLAERSGEGWREETYASVLDKVKVLAGSLLDLGLSSDKPILIISGNGVDHGILALAGQYVGIASMPIAEQYALIPQAHDRLKYAVDLVKPGLIYAVDGERYGAALALEELSGIPKLVSINPGKGHLVFEDLLKSGQGGDIASERNAVGPDTIAKLLLTSGSTSLPKAVETTHRMLVVNQAQINTYLPFLKDKPPRIVDWLPWNHVFGGSHNFNMMLANGGSLYIDDGKPVKGLFQRSLENLSRVAGTLAFNVPVGFAMLLEAMRKDDGLRERYFADLDMIFYAGASLPQDVWKGLEELAIKTSGQVPLLTSSWGLTETAPACTLQHQPPQSSGVIGVPVPGVIAKLLPLEGERWEIRVKGPSIFRRYFNDPAKTEEAFDEEGYFKPGDAVKFVDETAPEKGLRFDGRIAEDFKLMTGIWVKASQLRLDALAALAPFAADVIITGEGMNEIGMMIFPNRDAIAAAGFEMRDDGALCRAAGLEEEIASRITDMNAGSGSSNRITRAVLLSEPPSLADGEMTAKGNLNFRAVLKRRPDVFGRLYNEADSAVISV